MDILDESSFDEVCGVLLPYQGKLPAQLVNRAYQCACGRTHLLNELISIIAEGPQGCYLVQCPMNPHKLTLVKACFRWIAEFESLHSVAGHHIKL